MTGRLVAGLGRIGVAGGLVDRVESVLLECPEFLDSGPSIRLSKIHVNATTISLELKTPFFSGGFRNETIGTFTLELAR